jgi:2-keto-4-pentenoate hydratase/2-oxohepta-3-ene-1,7-dioic acid hydratase in catechol pathway
MKLGTIRTASGHASAVIEGDEVVDLTVADPSLPRSLTDLFALDPTLHAGVHDAVASGAGRLDRSTVTFAAPIPAPQKFFAIGLNYADHVAESGAPTPEFPTVFAKMSSCVNGPYDDVWKPSISDQLDYEGELGIVIGKRCKHVSESHAADVIAGFVVMNDVSVRDYQLRSQQWVLGKSFDTHGVVGPWIVTPDEIDPHRLDIRTLVNDEVRQQSNTKELIFDCYNLVALLSSACTLEPGDLIATGTPGGVGAATTSWLVPGDVVRVEIEGIGAIENHIVAEPVQGAS